MKKSDVCSRNNMLCSELRRSIRQLISVEVFEDALNNIYDHRVVEVKGATYHVKNSDFEWHVREMNFAFCRIFPRSILQILIHAYKLREILMSNIIVDIMIQKNVPGKSIDYYMLLLFFNVDRHTLYIFSQIMSAC